MNSSGNTIGSGNTVAENGGPGIVILGKSTGNAITQNSIYANAGIGIDLGGDGSDDNDGPAETACHDSDDGPNRRQNRCLLGPSADGTAIDGILNSACDREYRIEIFENPAGAFPSRRDGRKFIGEARIRTHPENGHAKFRIVGAKPGLVYTATVTDLSTRDTSEFSGRAEVGRSGPPEGGADFGDAPESYGTRFQSEGAYHLPGGELMLGSRVDFEPDGLTSSNALGDNETGDPLGDEDGVEFPALLRAGEIAAVVVSASADGFLEAWIDFGRDGSWDQPGDLILDGFPVTAGETTFEVPIPPAAVDGVSFARFRLSSLGGLGPRGPAPDGEVEDHAVRIQSDQVERSFRRGDTDGNGSLEITDAVALLGYLFLGGAEPRCPDASDADDNGAREITDAVVILGYLFLGGTEPAAPGPRVCGGDSTDDELGPCIGECEA